MTRTEGFAKLACAYSGVMWGIFWLPLRGMNEAGIVGAWSTVIFSLVPALLLVPLAVFHWRRLAAHGRTLQITGFVSGLSIVLYADAVIYTEVIRAMLLYYLTPVWSTLLARAVLKEPITAVRWVAIALGMAGMLVIFGIDTGFPWPRNVGDWMGLVAGLVWAYAAVRMRGRPDARAIDLTVVTFGWGLAAAIVIALLPIAGARAAPGLENLTGVLPWLVPVLLIVVLPGAFAALWGTPRLNPGIVGILFMTEISVGTLTAALWAGEPFGAREIAGIVLITAAGLAETVPDLRARRRAGAGLEDLS